VQFYAFDASYVERLRSGDTRTEEHFVGYFRELIQLKLRSRLKSKEAIEDVEQETFVRVLSALRSEQGLRQADRLGAYVNSVCNNVLLEHYRSQRRTEFLEDEDEGPAATLAAKGPDAFALLLTKETEKTVRDILDKLSERDRSLLRDVILEEQDKDEVCQRLGVDREYLRVLLHRAKQSFKSFLINHSPPRNFSGTDL
jgi:RNA polymerase sigma-70 factor, ECF subfamily